MRQDNYQNLMNCGSSDYDCSRLLSLSSFTITRGRSLGSIPFDRSASTKLPPPIIAPVDLDILSDLSMKQRAGFELIFDHNFGASRTATSYDCGGNCCDEQVLPHERRPSPV